MKKKLLLINPVARYIKRKSIFFKNYIDAPFQPLNLAIIAALTPDDWEIEIFDEIFEPFSYREADLVGVTACTSSANRVYKIAEGYRDRGVPTVMGGVHASMLPDEALRFVSTVVIGEAEGIWEQVIKDFETDNLQKVYQGSYLPMNKAPQPRRDLFNSKYIVGTIQTSRGCPHDCDFCSVTALNGRKYRKRPVEEVLDELETVPQKKIFFFDDNLFGKGKEDRERTISLFKGMARRGLNKQWACQASLNEVDDEELLYYASKAGCTMIILGVESEKEDSLAGLGKKNNFRKLARYNEVFKLINKFKISVYGTFMFGMDSDRIDDLHNRVHFINKSRVDVMHPSILTPYPGTKTYEKLNKNGRLLYTNYPKDWDYYDMSEILYKPTQMTEDEFRKAMIQCWVKLHNWRNIFYKFLKSLLYTKSQAAAVVSLLSNMVYRYITFSKIKEWKRQNNFQMKDELQKNKK